MRGEVLTDRLTRILYSTDASAYSEMPLGVAFPLDEGDIVELVRYAGRSGTGLIPRAAGTSIAGQVVGSGLVVDVGRHMNRVLAVNAAERCVRVQPGVVRDELNLALRPYGLFFSPETSTSNRCMIGGMVGNNSAGMHSPRYGSVRDHLVEARVVLADGSIATFRHLSRAEAHQKRLEPTLEGRIYDLVLRATDDPANAREITARFPDPRLRRRNHGYAIDMVRDAEGGVDLTKLLAGSEGTLAIATELTLGLDPLPPAHRAVMAVHCSCFDTVFRVNTAALSAGATAVELMDRLIINLSRSNAGQSENLFFLHGDPEAIVAVELQDESAEGLRRRLDSLEHGLSTLPGCYAFPRLEGDNIRRLWALRRAGLGVLSTMAGDAKPVSVVEDTAVAPELLGSYIADFRAMMKRLGLQSAYYAHLGAGELHLRPVLDLTTEAGRAMFRLVAERTRDLVLRYHGSLSGEHGDGRLRGEFVASMYGPRVYSLFRELKHTFDPHNILNPGKIIDAPPMDFSLRRLANSTLDHVPMFFAYRTGRTGRDLLRAVGQCGGAADCRAGALFGGGMCPVYRATGLEQHSTRARANALRTALTGRDAAQFNDAETLRVLDTCLSCKACKRECPSAVDMTRLRAEYLQQHYSRHGVPLRRWAVAMLPSIERMGSHVIHIYNVLLRSGIVHRLMGFDRRRALPELQIRSLSRWLADRPSVQAARRVYLYVDEFTDRQQAGVGRDFVLLAERMGYEVTQVPGIGPSGRTMLSAGMVERARRQAELNLRAMHGVITAEQPLVVLEPSAWSAFRDEYPALTGRSTDNVLLFDEWFVRECRAGHIGSERFDGRGTRVLLHEHCHEQALGGRRHITEQMLRLVPDLRVHRLPEGCCGMAGAFGYRRATYDLSMRIGAAALRDIITARRPGDIVVAAGISCRRQIADVCHCTALHPVTLLMSMLR